MKFEARNPKSETSTNIEIAEDRGNTLDAAFRDLNFEFVSYFGFRISDLGNRA